MSIFNNSVFPIKTYGNVPKRFEKEMKKAINVYPKELSHYIKENDALHNIRLAKNAVESFPNSPGVQKYLRETMSETSQCPINEAYSGASFTLNNNSEEIGLYCSPKRSHPANSGTASHEMTHKVDKVHQKLHNVFFSKTSEFADAATADIQNLPRMVEKYKTEVEKYKKVSIKYILQGNTPTNIVGNFKEIFADCGSALLGGTFSEIQFKVKVFEKLFPESVEATRKYFKFLGVKNL